MSVTLNELKELVADCTRKMHNFNKQVREQVVVSSRDRSDDSGATLSEILNDDTVGSINYGKGLQKLKAQIEWLETHMDKLKEIVSFEETGDINRSIPPPPDPEPK